MRCERGQATIEWVGLVLLASLVLGALATVVPVMDGRSFGGFLSHRIVCAVKGAACEQARADRALARTYGERDAALLRRHAPGVVYEPGERSLPVDYRDCRGRECAAAPDDRDLDAHRTEAGHRATAFTRVIRRNGRTYLQYWLYYPYSNSTFAGSDKLWRRSHLAQLATRLYSGRPGYPGYHRDDWEAYAVRIDRDGRVSVRSSSHGHWQWCKASHCHNRWGTPTGWTRVSRGSHAGHIPLDTYSPPPVAGRPGPMARPRRWRPRARLPGVHLRERTTTAEGLRLVPLERIGRRGYRPLGPSIKAPWRKRAYRHPESPES